MKRQYISPAINVHQLKVETAILAASTPLKTIKRGAGWGILNGELNGTLNYCEEPTDRAFDDGQNDIPVWSDEVSTY